ncbi:MAG: Tol-Pal system beta propeller repeat protein TolB [Candidatus Zixiibacteriota bacterium]|nr:MAG: Tol-Pal system beta propeller repeat protein TolB [candidate division Zixibacteria bacterium]HDL03025.1 Tol-Pal system beta propeller repeat protein TolB [candidate division Zixibacteria bacterium]
MKRFDKIFIIAILSILGTSVFGQSGLNVKDYTGRLQERRTFEPTKIAVEEARYVGIEYITASDSVIIRNCGIILQNDLDFSPYFENVPLDTFFMRHMEMDRMTLLGWKRLAAQYVIKLEVEFPRNNIRVRYRLYSTDSEREIKKERFETAKGDYRALVHEIANDIVKSLLGDEGIYRTKIVYSRKYGDAQELFIADFDGKNERQLTNNGSINILPAFSPDGEYIYFTSYVDDEPHIYMLNLKTNSVDLIASNPGLNTAPEVSPDGKSIACVLTKDGNSEIYLLDRKGKIKKRLTNSWAIETAPTWSPDGKEIAFTSDRAGSPQIYIMDKEGLNVRRISYHGNYNDSPCWSPRGDRIVYASRGSQFRIVSVDVTGKDFRVLADYGNNENPSLSPDGNHIIFTSTRMGVQELYTMDIFGRNQRKISSGGGCSNPAWSPYIK